MAITNSGLVAIAILVVVLWSCLVGERLTRRSADVEFAQSMRAIRTLRIKAQQTPVRHERPRRVLVRPAQS
jgi:hypothetical protein